MHSEEIAELMAKQICHECIGEEYLSKAVATNGVAAKCDYCGQTAASWRLDKLADRVETAFEHHYIRTTDQPESWHERLMADRESNYEWFREGQATVEAFQEAAEIGQEIAEDVQSILDNKYSHYDPSDMDVETEFSADCHYEEKRATDTTWQEDWRDFEKSIQSEARFFSRTAAAHLTKVFGHIDSLKTINNKPLIVNAGPQFALNHLFRARVFQSEDPLLKALSRPDLELGPPPARYASAGRMNAQGISVFYGATSLDSALAEVRPPVGSRVAIAKFNMIRPLRLLDLTALEHACDIGSIFDPTLKDRLERVAFLRSLGKRMTRSVMPDDQAHDYLATQAIADFLATENRPTLDGIVFQSAQAKDGRNVVLFHKASKVEGMPIPKGAKISASSGYGTDDGYEIDYSVSEEIAEAPAEDAQGRDSKYDELLAFISAMQDLDPRDDTLCVVPDSVEVHLVDWVQVHCTNFPVSRRRYERPKYLNNDF